MTQGGKHDKEKRRKKTLSTRVLKRRLCLAYLLRLLFFPYHVCLSLCLYFKILSARSDNEDTPSPLWVLVDGRAHPCDFSDGQCGMEGLTPRAERIGSSPPRGLNRLCDDRVGGVGGRGHEVADSEHCEQGDQYEIRAGHGFLRSVM
jgi:hypothetical protein